MELIDFILDMLNRAKQSMTKSLDSLSYHELIWRPGPECNSISIILFHIARFEDSIVQARLQGKLQLWEIAQWYQKLNLPVDASGHGYTVETLAAFVVPELNNLLEYADAVRAQTIEYLKNIHPTEFDRVINSPRFGDRTVRTIIGHVLIHAAEHAGEIAYLRGVQRGLNK